MLSEFKCNEVGVFLRYDAVFISVAEYRTCFMYYIHVYLYISAAVHLMENV